MFYCLLHLAVVIEASVVEVFLETVHRQFQHFDMTMTSQIIRAKVAVPVAPLATHLVWGDGAIF